MTQTSSAPPSNTDIIGDPGSDASFFSAAATSFSASAAGTTSPTTGAIPVTPPDPAPTFPVPRIVPEAVTPEAPMIEKGSAEPNDTTAASTTAWTIRGSLHLMESHIAVFPYPFRAETEAGVSFTPQFGGPI